MIPKRSILQARTHGSGLEVSMQGWDRVMRGRGQLDA